MLFSVFGRAGAEPFELDVIETDDVRLLYFDPFQTHLVPHVLRNFNNALTFQKKFFDWTPREKPTVVLTDLTDYANAGAVGSPFNGVALYAAPVSRTHETMLSNERFFMIINHELVHVANMDVANAQDNRWRRLFGGKPRPSDRHPESILYNYLTIPRMITPRWFLEGAATFMETWMGGGVGRGQGAYDEMVFRSMVRDDAYFYSNLGLVSEGMSVDFQSGANAYLYGTRFMTYLAYQYSPDQVVEWLKRSADSERYYSKQFLKIFGKSVEEAWQDWIEFEHVFQQSNLQSVREQPLTDAMPLTDRTLGSVSRYFVDTSRNELIGAFRYPGVVAHVGVLSMQDGDVRRVTDIKGPMTYRVTAPAWDPESRTLFYTADNVNFRDLMAVNIDTGAEQMLLKDARIGDIVYDRTDRSIWGLRHLNGYVSLVNIPYPYTNWNLVYDWPYGVVPYELDVSPDGKLLSASVGEVDGGQYLRVFDIAGLRNGEAEAVQEFDFSPSMPEGFVFTPDSQYLYGNSFYTGVSNIFRFEIATGELEAVSNAETGFFRPQPLPDGRLLVLEYTGQGFTPKTIEPVPLDEVSAITFLGAELARRYPVVDDWNVARSLRDVADAESLVIRRGKYRPIRELTSESRFPVIEGYRGSEAIGMHFLFSDPAQFNRASVTASYSVTGDLPSSEKLHINLSYQGLNWRAQYRHNGADFYDLFGPTKRARKGDAFIVGYDRALIFDTPRRMTLSAEAAYYTGLDTLPSNQNVAAQAIDEIGTLNVGLHYTNTRRSIGAVDHEKGWAWDINLGTDNSDVDTVFKPRVDLDFGFALPLKHSSIWFYNSAGSSSGDPTDPLGSFYFGSFGNNYVDDGSVKRYREYRSMPGFEIDELQARDFVKSTAEWNLPPLRFREVGTPSFFLSYIRPAIFFAALRADPGNSAERTLTSFGGQLDLNFTIGHRLPMTLSLGYANGYERGNRLSEEWMLSLKIL
ncbi:MAG: hypothetical protein HKN77_07040 [Woeseiaceae bacterium]|nr:hypothetical protein [Woeseiaceae bacterium]